MVAQFVMLPNPKADAEEPTLIFLTTPPNAQKAAHLYAKRWKIECLFRHLKTNGYNLEDLNLKEPPNKSLLMMKPLLPPLISWLFAKAGNDDDEFQPSATKTEAKQPEVSIFREGLAILTSKCFHFIEFLCYVFTILSPKNHAICKNVQ
ncbi:MAG: hypothetical protein IPM81_12820 [Saprospirales bacterium]|nr:hypothetical protein [Saprospirales bacterium]